MIINKSFSKILTLNEVTFSNGHISSGILGQYDFNVGKIYFFQSDNEDSANLFLRGIYGETHQISGERIYYGENKDNCSTVFSNNTLLKSDFSVLFLDTRNKLIYNNSVTTLSRWNSIFREDSPFVDDFLSKIINKDDPLFSILNIYPLLNKQLISLSSGETQRVLLYKTLLTPAKIILIEQPLTGLDNYTKNKFLSWLNNYNATSTLIIADTGNYLKSEILKIPLHSTYSNSSIGISESSSHINTKSTETENGSPLIAINHVTVSYNNTKILNDFSLTIFPSQRWLLIGHNGSGKTTILSLISGDNPQLYKNDITINGKTINKMSSIWEWRLNMGVVNNDLLFSISPTLTVRDVILSGFTQTTEPIPSITNNKDKVAECKILQENIIPTTPLTSLYGQLSRVDKLKTLFIRAIIHNPKILLLDELEVGLTDEDYKQLVNIIGNYIVKKDLACILATHFLTDIPKWITNKLELK